MLVEIMCTEFKDYSKPRGRILLREGLNTVLGSDSGSNSIGKSTFLMIIDFIFGGSDYVDKLTDVQTEIGVHTINFAFQFKDEVYYFARSTGDYNVVFSCDSDYKPLVNGSMSLNDYMEFLQRNYGLYLPGLSLRNAVGRFIRVYKRETLDEERPLHQAKQETAKSAIEGLLKIADLYFGIAVQSKITKESKEKYNTFKKAQQYQYIPFVTTQSEYKRNEVRIIELASQAEDLARKSSNGLLDLDSMQAERLSILKIDFSNFKRQRSKLISQLRAIRADKERGKKSFKRNFEDLQRFFPQVNLQRIESIEGFHKQLVGILKDEFSEMEENLQATLVLIEIEMKAIESSILKVGSTTNLTIAVLEHYAAIDKELKTLRAANDNFVKTKELNNTQKAYEETLNNLVRQQISKMQQSINLEMFKINHEIYNGKKTAPSLTISDASSYIFITPRDGGTGSQYKGLVVFDLAMLKLTPLPLLVHDSVMLKHIEDDAIEKILQLYTRTSKQVFIALDKEGSYSKEAQRIMKETKILQLTTGEGALFGRTWNEVKN